MKLYFENGQKLKKAKEITSNFGKGGRLWYPRCGDGGDLSPCCDLPSLPDYRDLGLLLDALREALDLCLAKEKAVRKRRKDAVLSSLIES